jgi:hypothetical protein
LPGDYRGDRARARASGPARSGQNDSRPSVAKTTRTGRPDGLTKARQDAVCEGLRAGLTLDDAATRAGVSGRSARRWRERGSGDDAPKRFRDFLEATDRARVELKFGDLAAIAVAGEGDWRARAWRLERLFPSEFGRQTKHQHTGPDGQPIELAVELGLDPHKLSDDELDTLAAFYGKAGRSRG